LIISFTTKCTKLPALTLECGQFGAFLTSSLNTSVCGEITAINFRKKSRGYMKIKPINKNQKYSYKLFNFRRKNMIG